MQRGFFSILNFILLTLGKSFFNFCTCCCLKPEKVQCNIPSSVNFTPCQKSECQCDEFSLLRCARPSFSPETLSHRCKPQHWRQVGVKPTCLGRKQRRLEKEMRTLDCLVFVFGLCPFVARLMANFYPSVARGDRQRQGTDRTGGRVEEAEKGNRRSWFCHLQKPAAPRWKRAKAFT